MAKSRDRRQFMATSSQSVLLVMDQYPPSKYDYLVHFDLEDHGVQVIPFKPNRQVELLALGLPLDMPDPPPADSPAKPS